MNRISNYNSSTSNFHSASGSSAKLKSSRMKLAIFWKSNGQIVRLSTKPGDQTDKTESPNLVSKTGLAKR